MSSDQAEGEPVRVELPAEVADWFHARADAVDVDPSTLLRRLLAAYRASAEVDVDLDGEAVELDLGSVGDAESLVEPVVEAAVVEALPSTAGDDEGAERELQDRLEALAAEAARTAVAEESTTAETADRLDELERRLSALEADLDEKIQDVRERVIEVKRDADAKAPADHDHQAIEAVARRLADLEEEVDTLGSSVAELADESTPDRLEAVEADLADVEDRLRTVAWVVRDLRETQESGTGTAALQELKRAAATADVARAKCENCGEGVDISLLTEPACPHCEATVSAVEPARGFFSKPTLRAASPLESGEDR